MKTHDDSQVNQDVKDELPTTTSSSRNQISPKAKLLTIILLIVIVSGALALAQQNQSTDSRSQAFDTAANQQASENCEGTPNNMLINSGFKKNLQNWKVGNNLRSLITTKGDPHCGKMLQVTPKSSRSEGAPKNSINQPVTVKAQKQYKLSLWAKTTIPSEYNNYVALRGIVAEYDLKEYKESMGYGLEVLNIELAPAQGVVSQDWQKFEGIGTVMKHSPVTRFYLLIDIHNNSTVSIDDIVLEEMPEATPTLEPFPTPTTFAADPQRVFVTSTTYNGNLGGVIGANRKCQERADIAGLNDEFKAWIATSEFKSYPYYLLTHYNETPYVTMDGTKIANNFSEIVDGAIDAPIYLNEFGEANENSGTESAVWTNSTNRGEGFHTESLNTTCQDYSINSGNEVGYTGISSDSEEGRINWSESNYSLPCNARAHLYCVEQ